jgi:transposase
MIQLVPQLKILLAYEPVDFRKGIDSLIALCRQKLEQDPFSGTLFLFRNRGATALKLLVYDGTGFWLCLKRFSRGRLCWWPSPTEETPLHPLAAQELSVLLYQGSPDQARFAEAWRELK